MAEEVGGNDESVDFDEVEVIRLEDDILIELMDTLAELTEGEVDGDTDDLLKPDKILVIFVTGADENELFNPLFILAIVNNVDDGNLPKVDGGVLRVFAVVDKKLLIR